MAKKLTNEENKERLRDKITADTEAFFAKGGKVQQVTHLDNAFFNASLAKKSKKESIAALKHKEDSSISAKRARKKRAAS